MKGRYIEKGRVDFVSSYLCVDLSLCLNWTCQSACICASICASIYIEGLAWIDWLILTISQSYHVGQFTYVYVSWFSHTSTQHNNLLKQLAAFSHRLSQLVEDKWRMSQWLWAWYETVVMPQLHRAIGDWSVVFWSEPMTTYLTPISPIGHLFSTYQLLLGKDKFYRWKITDWDF